MPVESSFMKECLKSKKYYIPSPHFNLRRDIEKYNDRLFFSLQNGFVCEFELEINKELRSVPSEIENLSKLKTINVYIRNFSKNIFEKCFKVESVVELNIFCFVSDMILLDLFYYFPNLEILRISGHGCRPVVKIKKSLNKIRKLHTLDFDHVNIESLPETIIDLKELTLLTIRNTTIKKLPLKLIESLESLAHLDIANNSELTMSEKDKKELEKKIDFFTYFNSV